MRATMGTMGLVRARASPVNSRTGPVRAWPMAAHGLVKHPMVHLAHGCPHRAQAGFVWAHAGSSGLPVRAPFKSLCKPSQIPHVAQTGLGTDRLGLPAQIPHGPRSGSLSGLWSICKLEHRPLQLGLQH